MTPKWMSERATNIYTNKKCLEIGYIYVKLNTWRIYLLKVRRHSTFLFSLSSLVILFWNSELLAISQSVIRNIFIKFSYIFVFRHHLLGRRYLFCFKIFSTSNMRITVYPRGQYLWWKYFNFTKTGIWISIKWLKIWLTQKIHKNPTETT